MPTYRSTEHTSSFSRCSRANAFPVDALEWNSTLFRQVHTLTLTSLWARLGNQRLHRPKWMLTRHAEKEKKQCPRETKWTNWITSAECITCIIINIIRCCSTGSSRAVKGFAVQAQANTLQIKRQLIIAYYSTSLNEKHTLSVCLCVCVFAATHNEPSMQSVWPGEGPIQVVVLSFTKCFQWLNLEWVMRACSTFYCADVFSLHICLFTQSPLDEWVICTNVVDSSEFIRILMAWSMQITQIEMRMFRILVRCQHKQDCSIFV